MLNKKKEAKTRLETFLIRRKNLNFSLFYLYGKKMHILKLFFIMRFLNLVLRIRGTAKLNFRGRKTSISLGNLAAVVERI